MAKHPTYQRTTKIGLVDCREIYNALEPDDQLIIDGWVNKFSSWNNGSGGPTQADTVYIDRFGYQSAFELVMKAVMFVVAKDPVLRRCGK